MAPVRAKVVYPARPSDIDAAGLNELHGHVTVHWIMWSLMNDSTGHMGPTMVRGFSVVAKTRPGRPGAGI